MFIKQKHIKKHLIILCVFLCNTLFSQNPILKGLGVSDPHVRVFNDTIFLYSGHDANPNDKTWVMKDWRVFSSIDLLNWSLQTTISPNDNYMDDNSTDCWASDAATRNGNYYFYFSDRKRGVGVMSAKSPTGNFKDVLGKPLVAPMHDPTILIDDDANKTPYLIYGDKEGGGFHITKLNEDMVSIAETPKPIQIIGNAWENAPHWMDKNYIFKHKDIYYLSWGRNYAISKNIYGPYECSGSVGNGYQLSEYAHGSFFKWKGQFYHIWCYYIKKGFKIEDYPILADLTENSSFDFIYESLVTYRIHKTSYSSNSHDFLDLKMFFAEKYGYSKDDIAKINENYYYTKLVSASVHFKPKDGNIAFKNLRGKKLLHYALYLSSQNRLFYKVLWFFRTLRF